MQQRFSVLKVLALLSVLTGALVLSCLGSDAFDQPAQSTTAHTMVMITGSLG